MPVTGDKKEPFLNQETESPEKLVIKAVDETAADNLADGSSDLSNSDSSNKDPGNLDPGNLDQSNLDPSNLDPSNLASSNSGPSNSDPSKSEPSNSDSSNSDSSNSDSSNLDPSNLDPSKSDPSKSDPSKSDPSKSDPSKSDPSKSDPSKSDPSKSDPSKSAPSNSDPSISDPGNLQSETQASESKTGEVANSSSRSSAIEAESDVAAAEAGSSLEANRELAKAKQPSMGKTFGIVAVLTVLSKVVGLVRDIVVAHAYGTGIIADAWNYAYLFTGNILILFGGLGGPYHSATVAILTPRKDSESAGKLLTQITLVTFVSLTAVCLVACLLSPYIASLSLSQYRIIHSNLPPELAGWSDAALKNLLQNQVREQFLIMAPLIVISGLVGISYGILNVYNRIFWPSLSPAIASIAIIVAIWGFSDPATAAYTGVPLAVGTLVGALGQLFAQTPDIMKSKLKWGFSKEKFDGTDEYSAMIWPAIFSTSVGQLIVYVDAFFTGTLGQGSWTAVLMSNRLVQLPLGVLLTAMLVPILPRFTQLVDAGSMEELKEELRRSLRFLCFLAFPMAALFLAIPSPIIRLLFQHGEFNNESTGLVTIALIFLAPSIMFYVARDLMTRVFYAFKDSKTPFHVALVAIVVKAFLDWLFVFVLKFDVRGISLASTLITILNLTLLTTFLKKRVGLLGFHKIVGPLSLMMLASVLCAGSAYGVSALMETAAVKATFASILPKTLSGNVLLLIEVGLSCGVAGLVYLFSCILFKLEELNMLVKRVPALGRILKR